MEQRRLTWLITRESGCSIHPSATNPIHFSRLEFMEFLQRVLSKYRIMAEDVALQHYIAEFKSGWRPDEDEVFFFTIDDISKNVTHHAGNINTQDENEIIEKSLRELHWDENEPLTLQFEGDDLMVSDGNHRLAIAAKIWGRNKKIPCRFDW